VRNKKLYKKQEKSDHLVVVPLREQAYTIFVHNFKRKIPGLPILISITTSKKLEDHQA
jgi:hypothetical protein